MEEKGGLGPGPGVHGVQVVNEGLHGLVGGPVGLLTGPGVGELLALAHLCLVLAVVLQQEGELRLKVGLTVLQFGVQAGLGLDFLEVGLDGALGVAPPPLQQHHARARFWR